MNDFVTDCFEAIESGCFFWRDAKIWLYLLVQIVFSLISELLLIVTFVLVVLSFVPTLLNMIPAYVPQAAAYLDQLKPFTQYGAPAAIAFLVILVASAVVASFLYGLVFSRGLSAAGLKPLKVDLGLAVKLLISAFVMCFLMLLPIHKRKSLILQLACYAVALISVFAFGVLGAGIAVFALCIAGASALYNLIQLTFMQIILLVREQGIYQAALDSVQMIAGKTLRLIALSIVVAIVISLIVAIIQLPLKMILTILFLGNIPASLVFSTVLTKFFEVVSSAAMLFASAAIFKQYFVDLKRAEVRSPGIKNIN